VLDVDAVMRLTLRLDPAATREAVARYVQEIDEMGAVLDAVDLPSTLDSIVFSPAWTAPDTAAAGE
jgi:hypothetical protein